MYCLHVQPKLELPDYTSDGDSKAGTAAFLGLDSNSVDVNASFAAALHGKWQAQLGSHRW
jgi:hypothetical protein